MREEYETQDGVQEAQTAVAVGTTVVVAITTAPLLCSDPDLARAHWGQSGAGYDSD